MPGGSATRSVSVETKEMSGQTTPEEHPEDLVLADSSWGVEKQDKGDYRAVTQIADINQAGPPIGFRSGKRSTLWKTRYREEEWVLFRRHVYREVVRDPIDATGVKEAIDEVAQVSAEVLSVAFRELIGAGFEESDLFVRLEKDLPKLFRDAGFIVWQELSQKEEDGLHPLDRMARRILSLSIKYGLPLDSKWAMRLNENSEEAEEKIENAIVLWVEEMLQPKQVEVGRQAIYPELKPLLFGGPLEQAIEIAAAKKFGGEEAVDEWMEDINSRVFGAFGPNRDDVRFRVSVKLPGALLKTNGWIHEDGRTFHDFLAGEAFPDGAGLQAESIVWNYEALSALGLGSLIPNNEAALDWISLAGGTGSPLVDKMPPALKDALFLCIESRSLEKLEALPLLNSEALLDWLSNPTR